MLIKIVETDDEIKKCYDTMCQLRPYIKREEFLPRVKEQADKGYQIAYVEDGGSVVSVAGFRINQNLAWGQFVYVDDPCYR